VCQRSFAQKPTSAASEVRKCRHVEQVVDERRHTQQRAVSVCGAPQCGQAHIATIAS
jgi:hypothetical protein